MFGLSLIWPEVRKPDSQLQLELFYLNSCFWGNFCKFFFFGVCMCVFRACELIFVNFWILWISICAGVTVWFWSWELFIDEDLTFYFMNFVFLRLILYELRVFKLFFYRVLCWISNAGFDCFMIFCLINVRIKFNLIGCTKTW